VRWGGVNKVGGRDGCGRKREEGDGGMGGGG